MSASSSNRQSVRTWLKSLLNSNDSASNEPTIPSSPSRSASFQDRHAHSNSADLISFHHSVDDDDPDFSPRLPIRSLSGGSGPISYLQAANTTTAQARSRQSISLDTSDNLFSLRREPPSPTISSSSSSSHDSSPRASKFARTFNHSASSLSHFIQHRRRASDNFKRLRADSNPGSNLPLESLKLSDATSAPTCPASNKSHSIPALQAEATPKLAQVGSASPAINQTSLLNSIGPPPISSAGVDARSAQVDSSLPNNDRIEPPEMAAAASSTLVETDPAPLLLPQGEPMLKVTHKKVMQRTFHLDPDLGQIVWQSKRNNRVNLESIREVRFGSSAASYRTSLNISSAHEPRWITIIYQRGGIYKALHLIALSDASLGRWRSSLLHLQNLRRALVGGVSASGSVEFRRNLWMRHHWKDADQSKDEKLSADEVLKLCRKLGIENNRVDLSKCFQAADTKARGYLDFQDFQLFVGLLKRRIEVEEIFVQWANVSLPSATELEPKPQDCSKIQPKQPPTVIPDALKSKGISLDNFSRFLRTEQRNSCFSDGQIVQLFQRYCNGSLFPSMPSDALMTYDSFLNFISSSDNPPLIDQMPIFSALHPGVENTSLVLSTSGNLASSTSQTTALSSADSRLAPDSDTKPDTTTSTTDERGTNHSGTKKAPPHLKKSNVQHDMTRPLGDYYISSSHNTYLVGGQWKGDSTIEGYIRALLQGARSVELDCWDGPNITPQITHGHTLTSKVAFQDVIDAIARYAFVTSPYPLILSLEVHNDVPQQDVMAKILRETLGESLLTERLDPNKPQTSDEELPSPNDLKYKVLVKAKNLYLAEAEHNQAAMTDGRTVVVDAPSTSATETTESESDAILSNARQLVQRVTGRRPKETEAGGSATVTGKKPKKVLMSSALASLLIYTVGVKCRGINKKEAYAIQHMISLSEKTALKFIRDRATRESLIKHNRNHLTRIYPSMSSFARVHASRNFNPLDMWATGCQLVALNWQTTDLGFELNQAMFTRNGRCGYVLKPSGLRVKEQMKESDSYLRFSVDLRVISAQQLPKKGKDKDKDRETDDRDPIDPYVAVTLHTPESWGKQPQSYVRDGKSISHLASSNSVEQGLSALFAKSEPNQHAASVVSSSLPSSQGTTTASESENFQPPKELRLAATPVVSSAAMESNKEAVSDTKNVTVAASLPSDPNLSSNSNPLDNPTLSPSSLKPGGTRLRTHRVKANGFSPCWNTVMSFQIQVPAGVNLEIDDPSHNVDIQRLCRGLLDLCFLRFEIYDEDLGDYESDSSSNSSNNSIDGNCVAAFTVSIGSLQQGYRHLPLYDSQLSQFLFSTLFIHAKIRFVGVNKTNKQEPQQEVVTKRVATTTVF